MNKKERILKRLNEIDFHDIPVEKISFKTEYYTDFIIDFALYDDEKEDYNYLTLKFLDIQDMRSNELVLNSESTLEIFSFDYQWNSIFEGQLLLLLGFGQPTFEVRIECQNIELSNTILDTIQNFGFFKTTMPKTRLADYYLGCLDGSVFIDINRNEDKRIYLRRISFDGYGCCNLDNVENYLSKEESLRFEEEFQKEKINQQFMSSLILKLIKINEEYLWIDALKKYGLSQKD